jgi:hypothetical protein
LAVILADFGTFLADFGNLGLARSLHPGCHRLSRFAFEGTAKGIVVAEATFLRQLMSSKRAMIINSLTIEVHEMTDAQVVDIGIVGHALSTEILAEIKAVCANGFGKLGKAQVVLQVELRFYTMSL